MQNLNIDSSDPDTWSIHGQVLNHIENCPGADFEDVASALGVPWVEASEAIRDLLREGYVEPQRTT